MLPLVALVAVGGAAYRWWDDDRLLGWLSLACVVAAFVSTTGARAYAAREDAAGARAGGALLGQVWPRVALASVLGSIALLVVSFA